MVYSFGKVKSTMRVAEKMTSRDSECEGVLAERGTTKLAAACYSSKLWCLWPGTSQHSASPEVLLDTVS